MRLPVPPALLALLLLALPVAAQPVHTITLEECLSLALSSNPDIRLSRQQVAEADALRREVRSALLPNISARGYAQQLSPNIPDFMLTLPEGLFPGLPSGDFVVAPAIRRRYEGAVRVDQTLFAGTELWNRLQAASSQGDAVREAETATADHVAFRVHQTYWRLYEALAGREAIATARRLVERHLEDVQNLRAEGMALESDVLAMRTRAAEVELQAVEADAAVRLARLDLAELTGLPLDTPFQPGDTPMSSLPESPAPFSRETVQRPDLRAQEHRVRAAQASVRAADAGWLPRVGLYWESLYSRPNQFFQPQEEVFKGNWAAGISVSLDLWNGGRQSAQAQAARTRLEQERTRLEDVRRRNRVAAQRAELELERAGAALTASGFARKHAEAAYEIARDRHGQGLAPTTELLDAELAWRLAQSRDIRARVELQIAHAALAYAQGTLRIHPR